MFESIHLNAYELKKYKYTWQIKAQIFFVICIPKYVIVIYGKYYVQKYFFYELFLVQKSQI